MSGALPAAIPRDGGGETRWLISKALAAQPKPYVLRMVKITSARYTCSSISEVGHTGWRYGVVSGSGSDVTVRPGSEAADASSLSAGS
jgi:hypothetical protein